MEKKKKKEKSLLHRKYEFSWEVLDVIIGGKSIVDMNRGLTGVPLYTREDVDRFVESYGYLLEDPIESAEVFGNFHEALSFIRKYFLHLDDQEGPDLEIPRKIVELTDVRDLILMARMSHPTQNNDEKSRLLKRWACAILKVMHAITHIDKDIRTPYFTDIQKQILDRFYKVIQRGKDGQLYIGDSAEDPIRIPLVQFETKPKKSRDSVLLKLLHKPEATGEEIFDRVAVRFITPTKLDALRVVKYLKDAMIVIPANIKPSRSRNTLIDLKYFRKHADRVLALVDLGEMTEEAAEQELHRMTEGEESGGSTAENPHTSQFYRSLQFTSRHLIKLKNPLFEDLKELKALAKTKTVHADVLKSIEGIDLKYLQREIRFFYPYEVQVVDVVSNEENEKGRSAHSAYKKSQVQAAMKRVMGSLLDATSE